MKITSPVELFFDQLRDLHSMEAQLPESFRRIGQITSCVELRDSVMAQSEESFRRKIRITEIFREHGISPGHDESKAIEGLIEGGENHLESVANDGTRDLMVIAHCLRVHFYGIAAYDIAGRLAEQLGFGVEAGKLSDLMAEEERAAERLGALEPQVFETAAAGVNH
jgi:ferritin-like metal-binding protein YciE